MIVYLLFKLVNAYSKYAAQFLCRYGVVCTKNNSNIMFFSQNNLHWHSL